MNPTLSLGAALAMLAMAVGGCSNPADASSGESTDNIGETALAPMPITWKKVADGPAGLEYASAKEADCPSGLLVLAAVHVSGPRSTELVASYDLRLCARDSSPLPKAVGSLGKASVPILRATDTSRLMYQGTSELPPSQTMAPWGPKDLRCRGVEGRGMENNIVCEATGAGRDAFLAILAAAVADTAADEAPAP